MVRELSWTPVASLIERRVIWDLSTVSSGGTLVPSTKACTRITQDKVLLMKIFFKQVKIFCDVFIRNKNPSMQ